MKAKNIFSNIFLAFAVFVLVCAVVFISTGDRNDHTRYFFNLKFYQTTTGSMEPQMKIKSIVVVRKADISEFAVGDVACFVRAGSAVAHRVVEVTGKGLQTKGDNNKVADAAIVKPDEIIGKCVLTMNWVADFLEGLETPMGIVRVVVLPALFIVSVLLAFAYFGMHRAAKKEKAGKEPVGDESKGK